MNRLFASGVIFGLVVALNAVISLAYVPLVISLAGTDVWADIAIGQSVGALAAVVVGFGWAVVGPAAVAALPEARRGQYYLDSFASRLLLFLVVGAPVQFIASGIITGFGERFAVVLLSGLVFVVAAAGATWFYVGTRRPVRLLVFDAIPRAAGTAVGMLILVLGGTVEAMFLLQLLGAIVASGLPLFYVRRVYSQVKFDFSFVRSVTRLREHLAGSMTAATAAGYTNAPVLVVEAVVPGGTAIFALVNRLVRFGLTAISPVSQIVQSYVPSPDGDIKQLHERVRRAVAVSLALGSVVFLVAVTALPAATSLMSGGTLEAGFSLCLPLALAASMISISGITGPACLVALSQQRLLAGSTIGGALVGIPLLWALAPSNGVIGVAWVIAGSEMLVAIVQLCVIAAVTRTSAR